jgi:hypothetical protein
MLQQCNSIALSSAPLSDGVSQAQGHSHPAVCPFVEYNRHLQSDDWSREETDYLVGLVTEYDIRWVLICRLYSSSVYRRGKRGLTLYLAKAYSCSGSFGTSSFSSCVHEQCPFGWPGFEPLAEKTRVGATTCSRTCTCTIRDLQIAAS